MWKNWIWRYWLGRLGRTVVFVTFVCLLCVGTTGYIVNGYIKALLGQYGIQLEENPFSAAEIWGSIWDFKHNVKPADAPANPETGGVGNPETGANLSEESGEAGSPGHVSEAEPGRDTGEIPGGEASREQVEPWEDPQQVYDGSEDAGEEQRQKAYDLLLGRLSAEQLDRLSAWLQNGLTEEEAMELEAMLRELFTEEELQRILQILEPLDERFRVF